MQNVYTEDAKLKKTKKKKKKTTQFQHHNITSDKLINQNNEKFYHVKQTPKTGDRRKWVTL